MKKIILSLICMALACVSHGQSVGQYSINKKVNSTGPLTAQHWTGATSSIWGQDGAGNPASYTLGAGLSFVGSTLVSTASLTNIASSISGATLTMDGTLTTGRTITWRDLAGTVALTSDLSAYQTTLTTGVFGLSMLAAADQAAAQTLLSLGTAAYATATSTEGSPTYVSYANHTHALAGSYLTGTLPISKGGTSTTTAPTAGKLLIGTSGGTYNVATITAGTGVTVTNGSGSITLAVDQAALSLTSIGGTLSVAKGGTGITSFGTGVATFLGTPSSANLATAVTGETGSGALVFGTSPTIATPTVSGFGLSGLLGVTGAGMTLTTGTNPSRIVQNNSTIDFVLDVTKGTGLRIVTADVLGTDDVFFQAATGSSGWGVFEGYGGLGTAICTSDSSDAIVLAPARVEKMRVTGTGLVGIGTPSPGELLEVAGNIKTSGHFVLPSGVLWLAGSGTPESVVTAPVGSLYTRTDGGTGTTLYVKESGTGNTGWAAK